MKDHGVGIAPDVQPRIFQRFERGVSGETVSGLGLGLYIVRQVLEAHGGSIHVDSVPGKGTRFVVELPNRARGDLMTAVTSTILVVEDNADIREAIVFALEAEGYVVKAALDGVDALEVLGSSPLPNLILLDMLMPRMNGWELVDALRQDPSAPTARIPVVAVTATSDKVHRTPEGLQGVLRKPFDLDALSATVKDVLSPLVAGSARL